MPWYHYQLLIKSLYYISYLISEWRLHSQYSYRDWCIYSILIKTFFFSWTFNRYFGSKTLYLLGLPYHWRCILPKLLFPLSMSFFFFYWFLCIHSSCNLFQEEISIHKNFNLLVTNITFYRNTQSSSTNGSSTIACSPPCSIFFFCSIIFLPLWSFELWLCVFPSLSLFLLVCIIFFGIKL